jgi:hypothetical protein
MTTYLGDPAEEDTVIFQAATTINKDGTWYMDGTTFTGQHPFFPNESETEHGVWRKDGTTLIVAGFWFSEMVVAPDSSLSLGRSICEGSFEDPDTVTGLCTYDFVPCPDSLLTPFGEPRCPDPTAGDFLELGDVGATTVHLVMTRFSP